MSRPYPRLGLDLSDLRPKSYEIVFLLFTLVCAVLIRFTPLQFSTELALVFFVNVLKIAGSVFGLSIPIILVRALVHGRRRGWGELRKPAAWGTLARPYWTVRFLILTLRRGIAVMGVIYFFLHLKHAILFLHTGNFDLLFWNLDRWVHFGIQPNVWLMERFGAHHNLAIVLDYLYIKFFGYQYLVAVLFLLEIRGRELSERFFLAVALLWSLGGFSYLALPADGPCYAILTRHALPDEYRRHLFPYPVTADHTSPAYFARYEESKIWIAKIFQERLWVSRAQFLFEATPPAAFYGIAAMPSLHVTGVVLYMLFLFTVSGHVPRIRISSMALRRGRLRRISYGLPDLAGLRRRVKMVAPTNGDGDVRYFVNVPFGRRKPITVRIAPWDRV
jgi:hypothetical protein